MVKVTIHHNSGEKAIREHIIEKFAQTDVYEKSVVEAYFYKKEEELSILNNDFKQLTESNQELEKELEKVKKQLKQIQS